MGRKNIFIVISQPVSSQRSKQLIFSNIFQENVSTLPSKSAYCRHLTFRSADIDQIGYVHEVLEIVRH